MRGLRRGFGRPRISGRRQQQGRGRGGQQQSEAGHSDGGAEFTRQSRRRQRGRPRISGRSQQQGHGRGGQQQLETPLPDAELSTVNEEEFEFLESPGLLAHASGVAGSGKSYVIRCIQSKVGAERCVLVAPTGCAAFLIRGRTLHSMFNIPVHLFHYGPLTGGRLKALQDRLQGVQFIFVDEKSMVSRDILRMIHERVCEAFPEDAVQGKMPFAGRTVVLFGDYRQLPPVGRSAMWREPHPAASLKAKKAFKLYEKFNESFTLTKSVRQAGDPEFQRIVDNIGNGIASPEEFQKLSERFDIRVSRNEFKDAIHLHAKKKESELFNLNKMGELIANQRSRGLEAEIACIDAVNTGGSIAANADSEKAGGLENRIMLCVGARVMLTANVWPEVGLTNGSIGEVVDIQWRGGRRPPQLPNGILVHFPQYEGPQDPNLPPGVVAILPVTRDILHDTAQLTRTQFPIMLAWSITIHKAQGQTFDQVHLHLANKEYNSGLTYVAVTRARRLDDIVLEPITFERYRMIEGQAVDDRLREECRLQSLDRGLPECDRLNLADIQARRLAAHRAYATPDRRTRGARDERSLGSSGRSRGRPRSAGRGSSGPSHRGEDRSRSPRDSSRDILSAVPPRETPRIHLHSTANRRRSRQVQDRTRLFQDPATVLLQVSEDTTAVPHAAPVWHLQRHAGFSFRFSGPRRLVSESCGLVNSGNRCFLNSVVQAIRFVPSLKEAIRRGATQADSTQRKKLLANAASLMQALDSDVFDHVDPSSFYRALYTSMRKYNDQSQHDAHELLGDLLPALGPVVERITGFMEEISMFCPSCPGEVTVQRQPAWSMMCPAPRSCGCNPNEIDSCGMVQGSTRGTSICEYVAQLYRGEQRERRCVSCNGNIGMTATRLITLPQVAIIATKPFIGVEDLPPLPLESGQSDNRPRRSVRNHIPARIESQVDLGSLGHADHTAIYQIRAFVVHEGASSNSGHYYTFCHDVRNNTWLEISDEDARTVSIDRVNSSPPFLAFYERA